MGIMNTLFGTPETPAPATSATPAAAKPTEPGNLPAGATPTDPPAGELAKPADEKPTSPLDAFQDLWQPNTDAEGKPIDNSPAVPAQLDPAELAKVIAKADLTKSITPDDLAAINAGGEEANAALIRAMNSVAQQTLNQSTLATNTMIEKAVEAATKATEARLAEQIRKQNLSDNLLESNPVFSNPAVKPVIEAVQSQLATKFPDATTAQLTKMAQDYVVAMGDSLSPAKPASATTDVTNPGGEDWGKFLGIQNQG